MDLLFWAAENNVPNDEFCGLGCLKCRTSASGKILSTQEIFC